MFLECRAKGVVVLAAASLVLSVLAVAVRAEAGPTAAAAADERIDVNMLVGNGLAWVSASPHDIGDPADVFDDNPSTLYRSAAVNPAFVQVSFAAPVTYTAFRVLLSHTFGDPAYRWKVDVANSQADMDARTGSFAEVVPFTGTVSDQFSTVTLSRPVSARLIRLTAHRLVGDDFVHIDEWQLTGRSPFNVLNGPRGLAAASNGTVYVAESGRDHVVAFDARGRQTKVIGATGSSRGQLRQPWDVAVDPCGSVTVVDRGNHRVQVFDPSGVVKRTFGGSGQAAGRLNRPAGVAVQAGSAAVPPGTCARSQPPTSGNQAWRIYVADTGNHRVQRFLADGTLDRRWGANGVVGSTGVVKRDHTGFDRPTAWPSARRASSTSRARTRTTATPRTTDGCGSCRPAGA
jgi:NHL repeat